MFNMSNIFWWSWQWHAELSQMSTIFDMCQLQSRTSEMLTFNNGDNGVFEDNGDPMTSLTGIIAGDGVNNFRWQFSRWPLSTESCHYNGDQLAIGDKNGDSDRVRHWAAIHCLYYNTMVTTNGAIVANSENPNSLCHFFRFCHFRHFSRYISENFLKLLIKVKMKFNEKNGYDPRAVVSVRLIVLWRPHLSWHITAWTVLEINIASVHLQKFARTIFSISIGV